MKRDPTFELIGGTPVTHSLSDLRLEPKQQFVSGDYEAATDRIHLHYTVFTAEQMVDHTDFIFPSILEEKWTSEQLTSWFRRYIVSSFRDIYVACSYGAGTPVSEGQFLMDNYMVHNGSYPPEELTQTKAGEMYEFPGFPGLDSHDLFLFGCANYGFGNYGEEEGAFRSYFTKLNRGQMMGHILSFPLLCMINYSASTRRKCGSI